MTEFKLRPQARLWLRSPAPGESGEDEERDPFGDGWGEWVLGRMAAGAVLDVGGVWVDRAVAEQRFECVPGLCAPRPGRGRWRSCCADLDVALSAAEHNRLRRHSRRLWDWLSTREPRLVRRGPRPERRPFWLAADGAHLSRPGRRCVFSAMDRQGRLRCRLHAYARAHAVQRQVVQPLPCRLFPLVLVELPTGGVLLTTLYRTTTRLVGTFPATRFPCLADPTHRLLSRSMSRDLDWLFGRGFARALRGSLP